jgi:hypothetical protein
MPKHSQQLFDLIESATVEALDKFLEEQKEEIGLVQLTALINQADDKGDTALHKAAKKNVPQILYALLFKDTDTSIVNKQGDTALHIAADMGNTTTLKHLVSRDQENKIINKLNSKGETPLQRAIVAKKIEGVLYLLGFMPFLDVKQSKKDIIQGLKMGQITEKNLLEIIETCQKTLARLEKIPHPDKEDKTHIKNLSTLIEEVKAKPKSAQSPGFSFSKLFSKDIPKETLPASSPASMGPPGPIP